MTAPGDDGRFYGKYLGHVRDVDDPDDRGRLRAFVPEVMGELDDVDHWTDWALPCFSPIAMLGVGSAGKALVPPKGDAWGVWVEFRHGDPRFPIWTGVFPFKPITADDTRLVLEALSVYIGGTIGAQALPRFETYRSAEDTLLTALQALCAALVTSAPPLGSPLQQGATSTAAGTAVTAITTFTTAAATYFATRGKVV